MQIDNSKDEFQNWLNETVVAQFKQNTLISTTLKQLNRDWKRFADIYAGCQWYEVGAIDKICEIANQKWIKQDIEDDYDEKIAEDNEVKGFERF